MKTSLRDTAGNVLKEIDLSDTVYAAAPNPDLLHQAFVYHQANQRQGTHDTLTRGDVSGGGRKPWIQKHTGRARQGSTRSPQWRGGGVAFGPHPRSYRKRLPIRMRRQALRCALSGKAAGERLIVVDELSIADGKTKQMAQVLRALEASKSALVVLREPQPSVTRAIRNLPRVKALAADLLNVFDLMRYDMVIMTEAAVRRTEELWGPTTVARGVGVAA